MALKFQQPNLPLAQDKVGALSEGMNTGMSLMLQYQQLKRQRAMDAQRTALTEEEMNLKREMLKNPQQYGGFYMDVNGVPQFVALPPGVKPAPVPSPAKAGTESVNITKSEFLQSPEKYREMGKLKIIDDTGGNANSSSEKKTLAVPGFDLKGDIVPSALEARQARDAVAQMESFEKGIVKLRDNIAQHGSTNLFGKGFSEARTLASDLQLTLKELAKLGVLSSSDEKFLVQQILDPSSLKSLRLTTPDALIQLDTTLTRAKEKFNAGMSSKGYQPKGNQSQGGGGVADGAPVYGGKIRITNGMETYEVDTSDLADAISEGFQVVQ